MSGMRTFAAVIISLSLGAVAGAFGMHYRLSPVLNDLRKADEDLLNKHVEQQKEVKAAQERAGQLERQKQELQEQLTAFRTKAPVFEAVRRAQAPLESPPEVSEQEGAVAEAGTAAPSGDEAADATPRSAGRFGRGPAADDGERESRRAQVQDWAAQFRENMSTVIQAEMDKTKDVAARQRLASLNDFYQYRAELLQSLRDAQTDEERESIRASLAEASETSRQLLRDQQDYMVRDLASQFGIKSSDEQEQFAASLQQMVSSPFFSPESRFMFGGPSFSRGGPGGGPGFPQRPGGRR